MSAEEDLQAEVAYLLSRVAPDADPEIEIKESLEWIANQLEAKTHGKPNSPHIAVVKSVVKELRQRAA